MSKADTLLKKATFFERLALYSDRKSFLQAVAQQRGGATRYWDEQPKQHSEQDVKAALQTMVDAANAWRNQFGKRMVDTPGSPRLWSPTLTNFMTELRNMISGSVDYDRAYKILSTLASQMPNNLAQLGIEDGEQQWTNTVSWPAQRVMKTIGEAVAWSKENIPRPPESETPQTEETGKFTIPEVTVPGRPARPSPATINRADQQAVARLYESLVRSGDAVPGADVSKMNDGVLGNETKKALEAIKDYYGKTYPTYDPKKGGKRMTDQQAINAAKSTASQAER